MNFGKCVYQLSATRALLKMVILENFLKGFSHLLPIIKEILTTIQEKVLLEAHKIIHGPKRRWRDFHHNLNSCLFVIIFIQDPIM